ncbi:serine--tRNA ligase [Gammaproteobacteria bacterium]|jgi:seryl-tRNA synthetase|nr:serine--tRNA ligase [Gammaproteobacteria bacterium]MDA9935656.1 serine--tRNA ligase [Gammaproteobacteria bacterium]MDA9965230.1 serine--tRNA ligase [Gammaproteobacteria bacterium]MDC0512981.1 serine--tRNA ligase [Gammaproteobacteria bacterium]MDC0919152.1 serine--tRNA ligase [Gammaproteobacteria bacterium]
MIDTNLIKDNPQRVLEALQSRNYDFNVESYKSLEAQRKIHQTETEDLQAKRNSLSKEYGLLKKEGKDDPALNSKIETIKTELDKCSSELNHIQSSLKEFLLDIPNLPADSVPNGSSEENNIKIRDHGEPRILNGKDHLEITSMIDTESANLLAGSRFSVLIGEIAKLQRALIAFMLDKAEEHGYTEHYLPMVANSESLTSTGQLPKFAEDLFQLTDDYYLIPTAEVPLTNLYRNQIVDMNKFPLKLSAHTSCFRSEAGSYGRDTKGLIRQHQFEKVELVQICHPDQSFEALENLTSHAESVLKDLNLPYQVVELCTGDLGFSAAKTYDLEVWIPSQETFREISSCSNCTDFQARRAKIRFKEKGVSKLAHTLNGSALAAGRALIAVIENNFDQKGTITVPEALHDYTKFSIIKV